MLHGRPGSRLHRQVKVVVVLYQVYRLRDRRRLLICENKVRPLTLIARESILIIIIVMLVLRRVKVEVVLAEIRGRRARPVIRGHDRLEHVLQRDPGEVSVGLLAD